MPEPTCRALCYSGAGCVSNVRTYLPVTVLQWCRLFKRCKNLPACRALCYRGAGCLSGVGTYLSGTVLQWCRLLKQCQNLPAGHCVTVLQAVLAMSEPTCRALCCRGADCLSNVRVYLLGTVLQGCRLFQQCLNLPAGHCVAVVQAVLSSVGTYLPSTVLQWCRLFKDSQNLHAGNCVAGVQTV